MPDEMEQAGRELEISDATKRLLLTGTHARLRLIARSMRLGKPSPNCSIRLP